MIISMSRPSGPDQTFVSVWNASEWMLLRWLGAMNGWRGAGGAKTGFGVHGSPVNVGGGSGPASPGSARTRRRHEQEREQDGAASEILCHVDDPTELEAAAFRRLVEHLRERSDVQNIDLMELAGFCRNCLSRWYREAAEERGIELSDADARELVYGMPYEEWKAKHQR